MRALTSANRCDLISQHIQRMNTAKLLEQAPQFGLIPSLGYLAHKHFNVVHIRLILGQLRVASSCSIHGIRCLALDGGQSVQLLPPLLSAIRVAAKATKIKSL